jgi:uncharacterized protein DUF1844
MSDEKKIIIDEDWKSQVASERQAMEREAEERAVQGQQDGAVAGADSQDSQAAGGQAAGGPPDAGELPPASMEMLLSTLAAEAMMSMGQMGVPGSEQPQKNLPQAKYIIDLIEVIQEKTKGNLSGQEEEIMTEMLHQLRMAYVAVQKE